MGLVEKKNEKKTCVGIKKNKQINKYSIKKMTTTIKPQMKYAKDKFVITFSNKVNIHVK